MLLLALSASTTAATHPWYDSPLPTAFGVVLSAVVAGLVSWRSRSRDADETHAHDDHERIDRLERRVDILENQRDARDDYIETLREHISARKPPPPPRYPWVGVAPYED